MFQYFVSFLQTNMEMDSGGKSLQYIQWCLDNCHRAQAAPRKLPPSSVEIAVRIWVSSEDWEIFYFFFVGNEASGNNCVQIFLP